MNDQPKPLVVFLSIIACLIYSYGIYLACKYSLLFKKLPNGTIEQIQKDIPTLLSTTVMGLAAVFSANLGALLGVAIAKPGSNFADTKSWRIWNVLLNLLKDTMNVRILASYFYIFSLIACCIVYAINQLDDTNAKYYTVPIVKQVAVSFLGVITIVLGLPLNVEVKPKITDDNK